MPIWRWRHSTATVKRFSRRAAKAGLTAIVTVGTTLPDCEKAVALTRLYKPVYAAVGIHPHEVKDIDAATYDALRGPRAAGEGRRHRRDRA